MAVSTLASATPVTTCPATLHAQAGPLHFSAPRTWAAARRAASPRPAIAVAGYYPAAVPSYAEVLIIADFAASGDEFHHRLIGIGQSLGSRISLLQLPDDKNPDQHDGASDILLEGLLERMRLPPGRCAIAATRPAVAIATSGGTLPKDKLIVVGRSCADVQPPAFDQLLDLAYECGCDLIAVDDLPDWD